METPFYNIESLATFLGCSEEELYKIKELGCDNMYSTFYIDKASGKIVPRNYPGNLREINAPNKWLKDIQKKLVPVFGAFKIHPANAGFIQGKGIKDAVEKVKEGDTLIHFDIKKFFDNHFEKYVKTKLTEKFKETFDFDLPKDLLQVLVKLLTKNNKLPQGSPASPCLVVTLNYEMDERLQALADKRHLNYVRYADDLAFSGEISYAESQEFVKEIVEAVKPFNINFKKLGIMRHSSKPILQGLRIESSEPEDKIFLNNILDIICKEINIKKEEAVISNYTKNTKVVGLELTSPELNKITIDKVKETLIPEITNKIEVLKTELGKTCTVVVKPNFYYVQSVKHLLGVNIQDGKYNFPRKDYENLRLTAMLAGRQKALLELSDRLSHVFDEKLVLDDSFNPQPYSFSRDSEKYRKDIIDGLAGIHLLNNFVTSSRKALTPSFRNLLINPLDMDQFNGILSHINNVDNAKYQKLNSIVERSFEKCNQQLREFFDAFNAGNLL